MQKTEREITNAAEIEKIIRTQGYLTFAMSRDDEPYLVSVNYARDPEDGTFYFHCAPTGKKVDVLGANPRVWCQVLEDNGYIQGKCDWAYRTVMFPGTVRFVSDPGEKRRALHLLVDRLERDAASRKRLLADMDLGEVRVGRIDPGPFTGKENVRPGPARRARRRRGVRSASSRGRRSRGRTS